MAWKLRSTRLAWLKVRARVRAGARAGAGARAKARVRVRVRVRVEAPIDAPRRPQSQAAAWCHRSLEGRGDGLQ